MKPEDVAFCVFDAVLTVLWWWFWYGLVSLLLGEAWGFIVVLVVVFAVKMYRKSNMTAQSR